MKERLFMRNIKAKKGLEIECKGWEQEAVLRMLYNNLDPEVAEKTRRFGCLWWHRESSSKLGGIRSN